MRLPRLRSVDKYKAPYPLNKFPQGFALTLGREVVYHLATRGCSRLEGPDWECMFATIIGAKWKPSNIGLDDVALGNTTWGAKTVKNAHPSRAKTIRLISGRNAPVFSFGKAVPDDYDPVATGRDVLAIWNARVKQVRERFRNVRTVILIKSENLLELAVFEIETVEHDPSCFDWKRNVRNNLEGARKEDGEHVFTWQPHGSQFTIVERVPKNRLAIKLKAPPSLDKESVLDSIAFDESWVEVLE